MDNLTHGLIGVLLARAALPWVGSLRGALWAAILASNAPDLDLVLSPFFDDRRLGYLVHHRGHTHTLVGALLLSLGVAAFARWRDPDAKPGPLVALSVVGALLHVGADGWNNYGVHPFWPVDSRWFYGDAVFILEPLLWLALLPLAWALAGTKVRGALTGLGVVLTAVVGFALGVPAGLGWAAATGGLAWLQRRRERVGIAAVLAIGSLVLFGLGTRAAEARLRAEMAERRPQEEVLDVVLAPRPASPWCWSAIVLSRDTTTYHARGVSVSLAPLLSHPSACDVRAGRARTAPLLPADLPAPNSPVVRVVWGERFEAPVGELARLATESCRVDAFLRFGRAPYWVDRGDHLIVGDLRYDYEAGLGFAEVEVRPGDTAGCDNLPPWRSSVARALLAESPAAAAAE